MLKLMISFLLFLNLAIHAADPMEELAVEIGQYIKNDWHKEDEESRQNQIVAFLAGLDTILSNSSTTPRKVARFFEKSLFKGWTEEELEQVFYDHVSVSDILYRISYLSIDEYSYSSPFRDQKQLEDSFLTEGSVKLLVSAAVLAKEKKREDFVLIFNDDLNSLDAREKVLSESFTKGKESISDISLGGAFIFVMMVKL